MLSSPHEKPVLRAAICRASCSHPPLSALDLTDEEDFAIRGYIAWRQLEHSLRAAAQAVESDTYRSGKKPRK